MDNEKRIFVLFTGYMLAGVRRRSAGDHFGMMQTVHHLRKWNELCFGHNYAGDCSPVIYDYAECWMYANQREVCVCKGNSEQMESVVNVHCRR